MKIIKHGSPLLTTKRFKCDMCGCVFEADKDEYKVGFWRNETLYSCQCPECGDTCSPLQNTKLTNYGAFL